MRSSRGHQAGKDLAFLDEEELFLVFVRTVAQVFLHDAKLQLRVPRRGFDPFNLRLDSVHPLGFDPCLVPLNRISRS